MVYFPTSRRYADHRDCELDPFPSLPSRVLFQGTALDAESWEQSTTFTPPPSEYVTRYNYTWDSAAYGKGPIQVGFPSWQWPDVGTVR